MSRLREVQSAHFVGTSRISIASGGGACSPVRPLVESAAQSGRRPGCNQPALFMSNAAVRLSSVPSLVSWATQTVEIGVVRGTMAMICALLMKAVG